MIKYEKKDLLLILLFLLAIIFIFIFYPTKKIELFIGESPAIINDNYNSIVIKADYNNTEKIKYRIYPLFTKVYIKPIYFGKEIGVYKDKKPFLIKNNKEYDLSKLGVYNILIIDYIFKKKKYDFYIFDGNIPIVNINLEKKSKKIGPEKKIPMAINIMENSESYIIDSTEGYIRKRGHYEKKYNIWFSKPVTLFGLPKRKKWSLVGNERDLVCIRDKLAFDLYGKIDTTKIYPRTVFVELFINGIYKGMYILEERYDYDLFGYKKNSDEFIKPAFIFRCDQSVVFRNEFNSLLGNFEKGSKSFYEKFLYYFKQIEPKIKKKNYLNEIWELVFFILYSDDEDFFNKKTGIFSKMDIDNVIDVFLLLQLTKNIDGTANNLYISKKETENIYEKSLFKISSWDHDWSFGHRIGNKVDPYGIIGVDTGKKTNMLFQRIFENDSIREKIKNRWFELRKDKWSNNNINNIIKQYTEKIKYAYNRIDNLFIYENPEKQLFTQNESINYMTEWLDLRLKWLDDYFEN